jgi:alkylation response protein AidB-like acyl-CoA dehydrogenase
VEDVVENFYRDNPDILFHLNHLDISKVVELKEDGFSGKDQYPEAPVNLDDAMDNYDRILDITGEIASKIIKPRAAEVDRIGAKFEKGEVILAPGTVEALERLKKSDLMGFTLPRRYGGLNFPKTIYSMAIEIISRADASLMNLFGLQEIGDTICKFGSQEQKQQFLPRFSSGEISGAMALTEPDAGSDLQTVMLKARQDDQGNWFLNGVKRFITNGCADVSLVMARSEEGTAGGRGLSLFIYERDEHLTIRRIEHKLGIHGSPTCELQFNNAPAQLLGRRKFGLIKYTLSLMNGARASVAAQAVGIAEAAYREADRYARDRVQFSKPIRQFSAIFEMLTHMKTGIEAARSLLYETSIIVDIKEGLEERIEQYPESAADLKEELKRYNRLAALFTPIVKAFASELANEVCYKAIQIHGGVGYTCEFEVERLYRDARITNIYEGTTQLQVVAAIGGVMGGVVVDWVNGFETEYDFSPVQALFDSAAACRKQLESAIAHIKEKKDGTLQEFHAARLVSIATDTIIAYLLTRDATFAERKQKVAKVFLVEALPRIKAALAYIESGETSVLELQNDIIF